MALNRALFKSWVSGQTFTARAYVYERGLILDELERISNTVRGQAIFTSADEPSGNIGDLWFDGN